MDFLLLLIGLAVAGFVVLVAAYVYQLATARDRAIGERLESRPVTHDVNSGTGLRQERQSLFDVIPVSSRARANLDGQLEQASWSMTVGEYLALRFVSAGSVAVLAYLLVSALGPSGLIAFLAGILAMFGGWAMPQMLLNRRRRQRREKIEEQLPDALMAVAKALRAGTGLLHGLAYAAEETPAPLGLELQRSLRDLQLGADPESVFTALADRLGSREMDIAVTAILVQRSVGGNLSETLMNVVNMVRDRARILAEVRVLTAEQRFSANAIALVPVFVAVAFILLNPGMGMLLITTVPGQIALAGAVLFQLVGLWLIKRMAVIEV